MGMVVQMGLPLAGHFNRRGFIDHFSQKKIIQVVERIEKG
jgi:hypothetical protein